MPLQRRLPKRGFTNIFKKEFLEVAVSKLGALGVDEIDPEILRRKNVVSKRGVMIKVLGDGEIEKAVTVKAHAFSKSAREKIEKAGGKAEIIGGAAAKAKPRKPAERVENEGESEDNGKD